MVTSFGCKEVAPEYIIGPPLERLQIIISGKESGLVSIFIILAISHFTICILSYLDFLMLEILDSGYTVMQQPLRCPILSSMEMNSNNRDTLLNSVHNEEISSHLLLLIIIIFITLPLVLESDLPIRLVLRIIPI